MTSRKQENVQWPAPLKARDSDLGEAVLAVIRQWRFLPRVKNGRPVAERAELPFMFSVPKKK